MLKNPQEAVACKGVQPSLSPLLTSAPLSTRNSTISRLSSMQAWKINNHELGLITKKKNLGQKIVNEPTYKVVYILEMR